VVLYRALFSRGFNSIVSYRGSVSVFFLTFIEVLLVVIFLYWRSLNLIVLEPIFGFFEVRIPLLVLIASLVFVSYLSINLLFLNKLRGVLRVLLSRHYYSWFRGVVPLNLLERLIYYLNIILFTISIVISRSLILPLSPAYWVFLILFIVLIM